MRITRHLLALALCTSTVASAVEPAQPPQAFASKWAYQPLEPLSAEALQGQQLYLKGLRADGTPLSGVRQLTPSQTLPVSGAQAACVQCHQRSGLGSVEGDVLVPPISGHALHEPSTVAVSMDTRAKRYLNATHEPYTTETLAKALREGIHASGRTLHALMPRYQLSEGEVRALDAYLQTLSATWSPGVSTHRIRIASVIAPDVSPAQKSAAVNMIRLMVSRKNLGTRPGRRHMVSALEFVLRTERQWEHEIWELTGPSDTWAAQLHAKQAQNPVFAIASGVARDWSPMHAFCQTEQVPCWFPVTEAVPDSANQDRYGLYFSAGVSLEAQVIAKAMLDARPKQAGRVLQLRSDDAVARHAAQVLDTQLQAAGTPTQTLVVAQGRAGDVARAIDQLTAQDQLVLWLRPDDLALLNTAPAPEAKVWTGALLSAADQIALPDSWRAHTTMAYPYELPWQREGNLSAFRSLLALTRQPLVDEAMQSQLYFAMSYLSETLGEMLNNLHRDYLIERAEMMLSRRERDTANAQMVAQRGLRKVALDQRQTYLASDAGASAPVAPTPTAWTASREGTSIYPSLSLGLGQRFASKGAWLVGLERTDPAWPFAKQAQWLVP